MEKEQIHIPSTNSSVRILTTKQDELSLQYVIELPNRKRNMISFRVIMVFAAMLSMIWARRLAIVVVSVSIILMLYYELSKVCKETVTIIKDTCITYSATTLLGRKMFQSVPLNRLLGIPVIENIMGSRVHGILNLMIRTGQEKSVQVPLFTSLRPNLDTINKIRHGILRYTEEAIEKNLCAFGKDNIMSTEDVFEKTRKCLAQSFKEMRNKKGS
ncbi:uncharacterized protein LOC134816461 [Bolinopsis microptera]|uniref:uncharacterized protein LOC134816461 n=1 Tax=Bolinopsis microptera TaxID=2820187 RepID=UPI00307ACD87